MVITLEKNTELIICPYCGWEDDDWIAGGIFEEWEDTQNTEIECPDCFKKFKVTLNISVSFTTTMECKLNGNFCIFEVIREYPFEGKDWIISKCKNCDTEKIEMI